MQKKKKKKWLKYNIYSKENKIRTIKFDIRLIM